MNTKTMDLQLSVQVIALDDIHNNPTSRLSIKWVQTTMDDFIEENK